MIRGARYRIKRLDGTALRFAIVGSKVREVALMRGQPLHRVKILRRVRA